MKRVICIFCCLLLLPLICACSSKKEELQEPVNFYYIANEVSYNSSSGVIRAEVREGTGFHSNLENYLHAYLQGPNSSDLQTYIPADVKIVSCSLFDDEAIIIFNDVFSKLTGTRLSTAASALLLSLHDYSGINAIRIQVENGQVDDKDEMHLKIEDIVLIDPVIFEQQ